MKLGFPHHDYYNGGRSEVTTTFDQPRRVVALSTMPPPSRDDDINQEQFDQLLSWLSPDRNTAAEKYEWIRKRLIKMFVCRGSNIPEDLADRTVNRVARKLREVLPG